MGGIQALDQLNDIRSKAPSLDDLIDQFSPENFKPEKYDEKTLNSLISYYLWYRAIACDDFRFFMTNIAGIAEYPNHNRRVNPETGKVYGEGLDWEGELSPHRDMAAFLHSKQTASDGRIYKHMEAPRTSYKSRMMQGYVLRDMCINPYQEMLWSSETEDQITKSAVKWMRSQFDHNRNLRLMLAGDPRFSEYGGDWKTQGSWNDSGFILRPAAGITRDDTILSGSLKKTTQGRHFGRIVLDDIVTINNLSDVGVDAVGRYVDELYNQLAGGGEFIVTGTRHASNDIYSTLLEAEDPATGEKLYQTFVVDAINENDEAVFSHLPMIVTGKQ